MKQGKIRRTASIAACAALLVAAIAGAGVARAGEGAKKAGGAAPNAAAAPGQAAARPAPLFELQGVDGRKVKLADLRGKVVIVDFWATWCGPCRKGIPDLMALYDQYKDKGLVVVGISVDRDQGGRSAMDAVKKFASANKINYPIVLTDAATPGNYGGVNSIPTAFVIDQKGNIRKKYVGLQPKERLEKDVRDLLAEA